MPRGGTAGEEGCARRCYGARVVAVRSADEWARELFGEMEVHLNRRAIILQLQREAFAAGAEAMREAAFHACKKSDIPGTTILSIRPIDLPGYPKDAP